MRSGKRISEHSEFPVGTAIGLIAIAAILDQRQPKTLDYEV
jgi:hypothetical protein